MSDNFRKERIEQLLKELEYEVIRGIMDGEIEEEMGFRFFVPISRKIPDGVVACEFRTRPAPRYLAVLDGEPPRLKVVE